MNLTFKLQPRLILAQSSHYSSTNFKGWNKDNHHDLLLSEVLPLTKQLWKETSWDLKEERIQTYDRRLKNKRERQEMEKIKTKISHKTTQQRRCHDMNILWFSNLKQLCILWMDGSSMQLKAIQRRRWTTWLPGLENWRMFVIGACHAAILTLLEAKTSNCF